MKKPGSRRTFFCCFLARRSAAHHAAHPARDKAAHEGAGISTAAATSTTASAAIVPAAATAAALAAARATIGAVGVLGALRGRHDLGQQRLVLQLVEIAARGIAACGLPALDHVAGVIVELAGDLGVETD